MNETDRLARIEIRWKAATPGPWFDREIIGEPIEKAMYVYSVGTDHPVICKMILASNVPIDSYSWRNDRKAIAAAPGDIAWLVLQVKQLRQRIKELEGLV